MRGRTWDWETPALCERSEVRVLLAPEMVPEVRAGPVRVNFIVLAYELALVMLWEGNPSETGQKLRQSK